MSDSGRSVSVCHLIATNFAGGPEKQILELSKRLRSRGWPVVVSSFEENRPHVELIERAQQSGLSTFLLSTHSSFSPRAILQLRAQLARHRVDVLVTHGYKANLVGRFATIVGRTWQVPVVRGYTSENWKIRLYEALDRCVLKTFPRLLAVSEATRQVLIQHGLPGERTQVLYNAVDCNLAVSAVDLRTELGLSPKAKLVVAAGRLSPEKGHRFLVEAVKLALGREPTIRAVILGSGSLEAALFRQIRELGVENEVILAGFRKDVLGCIAGADLVVNPSLSEGLPNVVLEAMSLKTPVVATDVGGVSELIRSENMGWLVKPGNPMALADALVEALSMSDVQRRTIAARAYRTVLESFSFEWQVQRFAEFCLEFVGR